jgi:hypothetical protein
MPLASSVERERTLSRHMAAALGIRSREDVARNIVTAISKGSPLTAPDVC